LLIFWIKIAGFDYFREFVTDLVKIILAFLIEFTVLYLLRFRPPENTSFSNLSELLYLGIYFLSVLAIMVVLQLLLRVSSTKEIIVYFLKKLKIPQR